MSKINKMINKITKKNNKLKNNKIINNKMND